MLEFLTANENFCDASDEEILNEDKEMKDVSENQEVLLVLPEDDLTAREKDGDLTDEIVIFMYYQFLSEHDVGNKNRKVTETDLYDFIEHLSKYEFDWMALRQIKLKAGLRLEKTKTYLEDSFYEETEAVIGENYAKKFPSFKRDAKGEKIRNENIRIRVQQ